MNDTLIGKAFKGGLWLYIGNVTSMFISYIYWLIISKITGSSSVVGEASTVIGMSSVLSTFYLLGLPRGVQRFLGMYSDDKKTFSEYFWTGLMIISSLGLLVSFLIYFLGKMYSDILPILAKEDVLFLLSILTLLAGIKTYVISYFMSKVKTEYNTLISLFSGIVKLAAGTLLVYLGYKLVGAILGYVLFYIILLSLSAYYMKEDLVSFKGIRRKVIFEEIKAGAASYIPSLLASMGGWLGVIFVYGIVSSESAGAYYIAYNLAMMVLMIPSFVSNVAYPLLSGSKNDREKDTLRLIRLNYAISLPLMTVVILYSKPILGIMGKEFVKANLEATLLSLNTPLIAITTAIVSLVYSYGLYLNVLIINTLTNATRTFLYFPLVNYLGSMGAALSFDIGSLLGFIASLLVAKKINLKFSWRTLCFSLIIPLIIGSLFYMMNIPFVLGSLLLIITSFIIYGRLGIVSKNDAREIFVNIAPRRLFNSKITNFIADIVFGG